MPIFGRFRIVSDHEDGLTDAVVETPQHAQHCPRVLSIQVARRFVRQQDRRMIHDRPRDSHTLLFAA